MLDARAEATTLGTQRVTSKDDAERERTDVGDCNGRAAPTWIHSGSGTPADRRGSAVGRCSPPR